MKITFAVLILAAFPGGAFAQALPSVPGRVAPVGPAVPLAPEAQKALELLQDRPKDLKDFQAKIEYTVKDARIGTANTRTGTVDFINDSTLGPTFSADFDTTIRGGRPQAQRQQIIFDGKQNVVKDFDAKQVFRRVIATKPGQGVNLNGPLPLPIGVPVKEVQEKFDVTVLPGANPPGVTVLKLVPKDPANFAFGDLRVTVDTNPGTRLPVKMESVDKTNGDLTTITLKDIQSNSGKAKLADSDVDKLIGAGWTLKN